MVKDAIHIVDPNKRVIIKDNVEPQFDKEDSQINLEMLDAIIKTAKIFKQAA